MKRFTVMDCPQRSDEWFAARVGRVTGSVAKGVTAVTKKGEEAAARRNLRIRLALERITGKTLDGNGFQTQAMKDGIEREPQAVMAYEAHSGRLLETTGFLRHNDLMAGCSLDGAFDDFAGIVEIKCPEHAAHLECLQTSKVPSEYAVQILHSLWVTGAEWCDFVSFQPDFPPLLRLKVIRVERDLIAIDSYELALALFLSEVELETDKIRQLEVGL